MSVWKTGGGGCKEQPFHSIQAGRCAMPLHFLIRIINVQRVLKDSVKVNHKNGLAWYNTTPSHAKNYLSSKLLWMSYINLRYIMFKSALISILYSWQSVFSVLHMCMFISKDYIYLTLGVIPLYIIVIHILSKNCIHVTYVYVIVGLCLI